MNIFSYTLSHQMGLQLEFHISQTVPIRNTCTYDEYVLCIQILHENSEIIPPCSINKIALNKRSLHTYTPYLPDSYSFGGILCKGILVVPARRFGVLLVEPARWISSSPGCHSAQDGGEKYPSQSPRTLPNQTQVRAD